MNRHQRRAAAKRGGEALCTSARPATDEIFQLGFKYHRAGQLAEAERCYRQILAVEPDHPEVHHLMGVIADQVGHHDVAADWIERAINRDRNNAVWISNLGLVQEHQGQFEEALLSYKRAIELKPDHIVAISRLANILERLGRFDESLAMHNRSLALNPNLNDALNNRGNILLKLGRRAEALRDYDQALISDSNYAEAHCNRGNVLKQLNRLDDALESYDKALALSPNLVPALSNRGVVFRDMNRPDDALANYDAALALDPNYVEALNNRGIVLADMGRYDEAVSSYNSALALAPNLAQVLNNRGIVLQRVNRLDEALADYDRSLTLNPNDADGLNGRGTVLLKLNLIHESEEMLRRAILLRPDHAEAHSNLGSVLLQMDRVAEAETVTRHAISLNPDSADAYCTLGAILIRTGASDEAEAAIQQAIMLRPGHAAAHHNLSVALMERGNLSEASEAAKRAIALAPLEPLYLRQLSEVRKFAAGDTYLTALEAMAENPAAFSIDQKIQLHFALGKAHIDIGRHEDGFRQFLTGNALKRSQFDYNADSALDEMDRLQDVFDTELLRGPEYCGERLPRPIFVVGMPRSGTTLVEQILASHPQIFGAGELKLFEHSVNGIRSTLQDAPAYTEAALHMSADDFRSLGARYIAGLRQLAPGASHVTDKMPANFLFTGLIHLALPDAIIIHAVRDPLDTCVSCFLKLFTEGNFQTYDLAELGRYYRRYQTLMAHWHRLLPSGRILDVTYEDMVDDVESGARRIIAHCGLPWDDRCLNFHLTKRPVRTASAAQVRQPIYTNSIQRWRHYEPFLEPLLTALSEDCRMDEFGGVNKTDQSQANG